MEQRWLFKNRNRQDDCAGHNWPGPATAPGFINAGDCAITSVAQRVFFLNCRCYGHDRLCRLVGRGGAPDHIVHRAAVSHC